MSQYTPAGPEVPSDIAHQEQTALRAVEKLGRRKGLGAPVRRALVERPNDLDGSPLSVLLSGRAASSGGGGRGGRLRVLLLVSIIWISAAAPYDTKRPARWWAELLGLEDPAGNGARAIRNSLKELEARKFVRLEENSQTGVPTVYLLDDARSGASYRAPGSASPKVGDSEATRYFRIPEILWTSGLCTKLSGPALAMYLISLSVGGRPQGQFFWFSPSLFREKFGLGDSTRKKGLRELVDHGVLSARTVSTDSTGLTTGRTFSRTIYLLGEEYRSTSVVIE